MKRFLLICVGMIMMGFGFSQTVNPIKWEYKINMLTKCEAELIITAKVDKGWHLYSQKHVNGLPLIFEFAPSTYYSNVGSVIEPESHKEYDDVFGHDVFYFTESEVVFKQSLKIRTNIPYKITGKITGQVCQYESGICMPINMDIQIDGLVCP